MASLVEELVTILIEEEAIYSKLNEYGEQKIQILIDADIPALEKLTALEQTASDELLSLSNKQAANLKDTAEKLQRINQQNVVLLNQAIEMTEFDITLLKSMRQAPETANYNKNAYNTGTILGSSGFDAKQ